MRKQDAYEMGKDAGYNCASWQDLPEVGEEYFTDSYGKITCTKENTEDIFLSFCFEAESNSRQFSPFEFTAYEFNTARNSESLWDAYDEGLNDGFIENWNSRKDYYKD